MKQLKAAAVCGLFCMLAGGGAVAAEKELKTIRVGDDAKETLTSETRLVYTYAELGYTHTEYEDLGEDGFGVGGSFLIIPNLFVVGALQMAETDTIPVINETLETTAYNLGIGYRYGLSQDLDLVGTVRAVQMELQVGNASDDDTGYQVAAGARWLPMEMVEVGGNVQYQDIFEDGDVTVNLSGLYHIIPLVSAGLNLTFGDKFGDSITAYGATVRFNFQ